MTDKRMKFFKGIEDRLTAQQYRIVIESLAGNDGTETYGSVGLRAEERFYILMRELIATYAEYSEDEANPAAMLASAAELIDCFYSQGMFDCDDAETEDRPC